MDFTREPIIETVITPRDGCKIVVRSSKTSGQEEHFVDAVEVISFGGATFFRSLERPKAFLVPASDYEVLEVREARIVLKNVGLDRSIKIAGGRDASSKPSLKEERASREERSRDEKSREERHRDERSRDERPREERQRDERPESAETSREAQESSAQEGKSADGRGPRRDRRRGRGRRRGESEESSAPADGASQVQGERAEHESAGAMGENPPSEADKMSSAILSALLTPPPTLISETLNRYRDNALFQSAFYTREELEKDDASKSMQSPEIGAYEVSIDEQHKVRELLPEEHAFSAQAEAVEEPAAPESPVSEPAHPEPVEEAKKSDA